jgi:hypothetical protein
MKKKQVQQRKQELSFAADKSDHHYRSTTVIVSLRLGLGEAFYLVMGFV